MENKIKRFLSLLLALVMVIGMMPLNHVHAEEDTASTATAITTATEIVSGRQYVITSARLDASSHPIRPLLNEIASDGVALGDTGTYSPFWTITATETAGSYTVSTTSTDGTTVYLKINDGGGATLTTDVAAVSIRSSTKSEKNTEYGIGSWEIYSGSNYLNYKTNPNRAATWTENDTGSQWLLYEADPYNKAAWTQVSVDSETVDGAWSEGEFVNAFDGYYHTKWHSNWANSANNKVTDKNGTTGTHETISGAIDFGQEYTINQFSFTPRQDVPLNTDANGSGVVMKASLYVKNADDADWKLVADSVEFAHNQNTKTFCFPAQSVRYAKFEAEMASDGWVVVSEFDIDNDSAHTYNGVATTPATCTTEGVMTYTCAACGNSYAEVIPADTTNGHAWSDWTEETPSTCIAAGTEKRVCSNDASHVETKEIALAEHSWGEGVVTTTPGCETEGVKTYTCTVNNCTETKTESIPAAHTPGTPAQEDVVAPSCYQDGSYNTVTRCTVCTAIISSVPGTTPATGNHTWNEGEVTTDPGCETAGVKTFNCTVDGCNATKTEAVDATGHTEETIPAVEPSFDAAGATAGVKCSVCNTILTAPTTIPAKVAVAQIGDNKYESLAEAVAEANDDDTVTLLADATGAGVVINKSITIDLGGNTYTINSPVGSAGTETNGFQILENNTVTIQNGKLEVAAEYADKFYMLIQNYADLTVANVTLDGTNLDRRINSDGYSYVLSNNSGTVNITGTTNITANNDGGDNAFALDACKYGSYEAPTVTVNTTGAIAGNIEVTGGDLKVQAATITGELVYDSGSVTKAESVTLAAPADYKWDNGTLTAKTYVAQVGETKYESLAVAVAEAADGSEVKLLANANGDGIVIDKNITIDLAGYTYTIDGTLVGSANTQSNGFQIKSGNTVTIKNGDIVMDDAAKRGHDGQTGRNFVIQNYANLTLENVDITGNNETTYVVSINSGNVAINGTTSITAPAGAIAFDVYDYSSAGYAVPTVNVSTTGTITGKIEVSKTATLAISSGTYTVALEESWCAEGFMPTEVEGGYGVAECDTYTWYDENDNALYTKKVAKGAGAPAANTYDVPAKEGFTGSWTTVDGGYKATYTEIVVEDKVTLVGYEAVYDAEIAMRVCIDIPDSMVNNVSVVMTKAGNWGEVTKTFSGDTLVYNDAKGGYVVEMGVASGEMARAITVKVLEGETELMLYGSEGELGTSWTSTIKDYVKAMMDSDYGQDNKNAAAAMIVYGGYAQKFFGVDAETPAYDVLGADHAAMTALNNVTLDNVDAYRTTQNSVDNGIRASSLEAFLDSSTYLRVSFVLDEGESIDNYSFELTYPVDGQEATMSLEPVYNAQSGKYYVDIPDIVAAYLDYNYTITATNIQTQEAYTVTTSVLAWVRLVMKNASSSADRLNMVKALYLYNQAVNTLFA